MDAVPDRHRLNRRAFFLFSWATAEKKEKRASEFASRSVNGASRPGRIIQHVADPLRRAVDARTLCSDDCCARERREVAQQHIRAGGKYAESGSRARRLGIQGWRLLASPFRSGLDREWTSENGILPRRARTSSRHSCQGRHLLRHDRLQPLSPGLDTTSAGSSLGPKIADCGEASASGTLLSRQRG